MTSGTSNGTGAEALLGLDGLLTDDQRAWRDRARAVASVIARCRALPEWAEVTAAGDFAKKAAGRVAGGNRTPRLPRNRA